jgi:hypothetical protein
MDQDPLLPFFPLLQAKTSVRGEKKSIQKQ